MPVTQAHPPRVIFHHAKAMRRFNWQSVSGATGIAGSSSRWVSSSNPHKTGRSSNFAAFTTFLPSNELPGRWLETWRKTQFDWKLQETWTKDDHIKPSRTLRFTDKRPGTRPHSGFAWSAAGTEQCFHCRLYGQQTCALSRASLVWWPCWHWRHGKVSLTGENTSNDVRQASLSDKNLWKTLYNPRFETSLRPLARSRGVKRIPGYLKWKLSATHLSATLTLTIAAAIQPYICIANSLVHKICVT